MVSLDLRRILSRLRSKHAKRTQRTAGKPGLITQLNEVLDDKSVKTRPGIIEKRLKCVRDRARALQALFTRLERISDPSGGTAEVQEILEEIVMEAHEITTAADLSLALQYFSGNPNLKMHLPEAIGKLGRYYSICSELVCAARDTTCRAFRNIQVEPFQIEVPASIEDTHYKVHAEIQLLFFYELHPERPRPRIICSSKSACYLCNLFFQLHGGFHVPRTHGRRYDKWILPYWLDVPMKRQQELGIVSTKLKATLDTKIRTASKSKKRPCSHPNESVLLPSACYPSSSALSKNLLSLSPTSRSTIRPRSPPVQEVIAPSTAELRSNGAEDISTLETVSLIDIGRDELPCRQPVTLTTPSLYLQIDKLSLTVDFVQVSSGHLLITRAGDAAVESKDCSVANIEDIPTSTELPLKCPHGSNELTIQFRSSCNVIICVVFIWDRPLIGTEAQRARRC